MMIEFSIGIEKLTMKYTKKEGKYITITKERKSSSYRCSSITQPTGTVKTKSCVFNDVW